MTKENAHLYLPLVQALAEGKTVQLSIAGRWTDKYEYSFGNDPESYRIKPEEQPRPLGPEDVPPGSVFNLAGDTGWRAPVLVSKSGVTILNMLCTDPFATMSCKTWAELMEDWTIKRPNEDWKPCSK
jgi:hypothetical protein